MRYRLDRGFDGLVKNGKEGETSAGKRRPNGNVLCESRLIEMSDGTILSFPHSGSSLLWHNYQAKIHCNMYQE